MSEEKELFSTRDIHLAATLVTLKCYMVGVDYQHEGDNPRLVGYFKFNDTEELRDIEKKYWQGLLSVEPRTFISNFRGLKAQITNTYKKPQY